MSHTLATKQEALTKPETASPSTDSRFPAEGLQALKELYAKYGNDQTVAQKINVHDLITGGVSHISGRYDTEEQRQRVHLVLMEHEYLCNIGILTPELA